MTDKDALFNNEALKTFFVESREGLDSMESALLDIEKGEHDPELLNLIFRCVHTIKGSSGMFGFSYIENFSHSLESLLDKVRKGTITIEERMIAMLFEAVDFFHTLLDWAEEHGCTIIDEEILRLGDSLLDRIRTYLPDLPVADKNAAKLAVSAAATVIADPGSDTVANECWHISVRLGRDVFRMGMDPQSFINYLQKLGKIERITTVGDTIPNINDLDPECCHLGFEIDFTGDVTKEKLENVFDFVKEDSIIRIIPPKSNINEYISLINDLPEKNIRIGEILKQVGSLTEYELERAVEIQKTRRSESSGLNSERLGEIIAEEHMVQKPVIDAALEKQESVRKKQGTMRIDAEKLDGLINLVGELVITGANIKQLVESGSTDRARMVESVSVMSRLIEYIRDSTMSIRMVPIGETFRRFERIIRDLSRERGKEIDLEVNGGETELDKTLIEKLTDPLMHLIRNSLDHGIGTPEERSAKGKPGRGTIRLNAYHETGNVVIEVIDDGDGLSRKKIFAKAVEMGMIEPDQSIADEDLFQFIFDAGFSTAKTVTNISGRGVGMDVVKKNIEELRGTIVLNSEEGRGMLIRIHLPLTLSIIDGFMFKTGDSYYVIPLDVVIECTEASREELFARDGGNYINLRGEVLPFMRLREFFKEEGEEPPITNVIVVKYGGGMAGLVVDQLIGELQTVIKPLGDLFGKLKWISGSTILGTGEVAMILDVPNLIKSIKSSDSIREGAFQRGRVAEDSEMKIF